MGPERLLSYFIAHLNRIYCAKLHIAENLPIIGDHANFKDLKNALREVLDDVKNQLTRMDRIYHLLDKHYSALNCAGILGLIEETYQAINDNSYDRVLQDLSILYYVQHMESIEVAAFKVMQLAAVQLKSKEVSQLLQENFDEAKEDRTLLLLINAKYLMN